MKDVVFVTVDDCFALIRARPDLFVRGEIVRKGCISRSALFEMINPRRRGKCKPDPKLSSLQRLLHGCGGKLLVALPPSAAPDLPKDTPS
jgi:hypothetical protein